MPITLSDAPFERIHAGGMPPGRPDPGDEPPGGGDDDEEDDDDEEGSPA